MATAKKKSSKKTTKSKDLTIVSARLKNPNSNKAEKKAIKAYDKAKTNYDKANSKFKSKDKVYQALAKKRDKAREKGNKVTEAKYQKQINARYPAWNSAKKKLDSQKAAKDKAKKNLDKLISSDKKYTVNKLTKKVNTQKKKNWAPEGKAGIFQSSGNDSTIIYLHPTDNESVTTASNVTSWAVDKGSPRSDYARISSKQVTLSGVLTDGSTKALAKYDTLRTWNSRHYELTYKGNIYLKHLIITNLERSYSGYKSDIKVNITFTFVYAAEVTTSSKDKNHSKTSKSQKTTEGDRNKSYTVITIKSGDTLYKLSKKYGKSVSWLQKVNKISNPNLIYAGKKLRVK
ncbi:LysM peptidoglycan-binding domain-containing protein [Lactobacillus sp.]|uniref:LysM peptidoglycan-binding domain-containing protein n=1 Tax=Lactobacillus sp. TaxID=1591 RepID=UPI00199D2369|nr:LysM peptidoglycan-binding domain-containing protein [Lactobacillus sp.]MBD5430146.1 LysM peptidoglycan-binding domain-containing protein [Lactobacillus sp.]